VVDYDKLFIQNRSGMAIAQITELPIFANTAGVEYGVAPIPQFGDKPAAFALGHVFVVPRGTAEEKKKAGLVFVKWLSENAIAWAKTGKLPARQSVMASEEFKALTDQSKIAATVAPNMKFPPIIAAQPTIDRIVQETMEAFYGTRLTPEQAAAAMAAGIRRELAKS